MASPSASATKVVQGCTARLRREFAETPSKPPRLGLPVGGPVRRSRYPVNRASPQRPVGGRLQRGGSGLLALASREVERILTVGTAVLLEGRRFVAVRCFTLDGPVVTAARAALDADRVDLVLPYVPSDGEDEVRAAFELARKARPGGEAAREVAVLYFFDTVVRVHRRGEGAPHTGLKPAGLDVGPVIPLAAQAADTGDTAPLLALLRDELERQVTRRCQQVRSLAAHADEGVPAARAATSARLGLLVWSHKLHAAMQVNIHEDGHGEMHRHRPAPCEIGATRERAPIADVGGARSGRGVPDR